MGPTSSASGPLKAQPKPGIHTPSTSLFQRCRVRLGFRTTYAFVLWSIFSGFMALFTFIRAPYLHPATFAAGSSPGEWYWLQQRPYYFGIFLHLYCTIPGGFLSIFQSIPVIQTTAPWVHRIIGYTIMVLIFLGNIGVIIISRVSMGGNDLNLSFAIAFLAVGTTGGMYLAWYNIRRKQIDQHRKWMLRAMFWMGTIITMRMIQFSLVFPIGYLGHYATLWTCEQVKSVTWNSTAFYDEFPACRLGMNTYVGVPADFGSPLHIGSLIRLTFATATWIAIVLHTFGVELYLHLTPRESERLRTVSYYKQQAAGLSPLGSAGITADRWGDSSPWAKNKTD